MASFPCSFVTGSAGTGKTFSMKLKMAENPRFGVLASTTGISAVNLGAITVNSLLGYFDTESMAEAYIKGSIGRKLKLLAETYENIVIDEVSMMDARQLDILYDSVSELNDSDFMEGRQMGIQLTGDFLQLPPVKSTWAFEADCWPSFAENTIRLTKQWRQADPAFLDAINLIRSGQGIEGAYALQKCGVEFLSKPIDTFDGTTIMGKNDEVDRYNKMRLHLLKGRDLRSRAIRWGKQRSEWKNIPEELHLKLGAFVMILSNDAPKFSFVNGDTGHITGYDKELGMFKVRLIRNGAEVDIGAIVRYVEQKNEPDEEEKKKMPWSYYDEKRRKWILGSVKFHPLRLAYAATVHKTQSLSLDRIQMDARGAFFGQPHMVYVAVSRARTAGGLKVVGTPSLLAKRVNILPEVKKWL